MKRLEEIYNECECNKKSEILEAMKKYAEECVKASLEKASKEGNLLITDFLSQNSTQTLNVFFDKSLRGETERKVELNKESITNIENIVLL